MDGDCGGHGVAIEKIHIHRGGGWGSVTKSGLHYMFKVAISKNIYVYS